ncbi:diacylglycerol/lipid kinase family protein [Luteococcus peritonei]|uniref:Diacylglycerol/lipid kinase family protein n=1 Tax=Luteococcus peritonei TaxID=88874 RepID=A0ABW4RRV0_9ACTN
MANPAAGRGRGAKALPSLVQRLRRAGHRLHVHESTSYADARLRTVQAVAASQPGDALVVVGGDGMAHLGLNACAGTQVPLGVVPVGTGNDFCRGTGAARSVAAASRAIAAGRTRLVDLAEVTGALREGAERRWVGSVVSTGYDARVNRRANAFPWSLGPASPLAYAGIALAELRTFEPMHYRLTIDGAVRELPAMFVAVGNAGYFGGGMNICPRADVTDGLLEVMLIHPVSRATLLRLLPSAFTGGYVKDPAVEHLRAREVRVAGTDEAGQAMFAMADGEELGPAPVTVRAVPGALHLFVP